MVTTGDRIRGVRTARAGIRPGVLLAAAVLFVMVVAALWPGLLAPHSADAVDPLATFAGPGAAHPLGTDQLGRDVLSRVVYGARPSLVIGLGATAVAFVGGCALGLLAGAGNRVVDEIVMRVNDVLLAFPGLLLALLVVAVLGPGTGNAMLAVGCAMVPGFSRLTRAQALVIRSSGYVRSAVTFGASRASIYIRHVLPNAVPPVLALATVNIGTAMIAGSSLSFLGLGPKPPTPEWGYMLAEGRDYLSVSWSPAVVPGLAIALTVISAHVVGRWLRVRFDGRGNDDHA
jgi:peptide/nickel transport system permease protein